MCFRFEKFIIKDKVYVLFCTYTLFRMKAKLLLLFFLPLTNSSTKSFCQFVLTQRTNLNDEER